MMVSNKIDVSFNNPFLIQPDKSFPRSVAVIGSGTIGPDIGYYLKSSIPDVVLYLVDVEDTPLILAKDRINNYIKKAIKLKKVSSSLAEKIGNNIIYTTRYEDISECDIVIEAATENLELKRSIFSKIEKLVSENTIITSNTSSIPASRIFKNMQYSSRTAVTHFFAPAWRSLPVEVVGWDGTSQSTIDFLYWFFASTGKVPIVTKDVVCFMLDRIFDNWCNEAASLLTNASAAQIDKVAEEFVHAGPFFVLNMAKGNSIIFETNSLQMEEGKHYKPFEIFRSVDTWLTCNPGANVDIPNHKISKLRDRLLGILFSQSFDILDNNIGTFADLNLGCEIALGFLKGPLDLMESMDDVEIKRINETFQKERPGFPKPNNSLKHYKNFKRFILEDDFKGVKVLTIRRPQAMNALNDIVTNEILDILQCYSKDDNVSGFIITGFGKSAFSAGADIGKFPSMLGNYDLAIEYARKCAKVQRFIDNMDKPIVAAINGLALGGGLEIAIRCHGIVAVQNSIFQFPEVSLGILPGIGGCIIPYRKWPSGKEVFDKMILLSRKITAEKAIKIGMIDKIASGCDELIFKSFEVLENLKGKIQDGEIKKHEYSNFTIDLPDKKTLMDLNLSLETVLIIAETIKAGVLEKDLDNALEIGYKGFARTACTNSAKEGITAFMERREPIF